MPAAFANGIQLTGKPCRAQSASLHSLRFCLILLKLCLESFPVSRHLCLLLRSLLLARCLLLIAKLLARLTGHLILELLCLLNLSGNIAYNINVVTDLGGLDEISSDSGWASSEISGDYLVKKDEPLGNMYGYVSDGFYTVDDFEGYIGGKWVLKEGVANDKDIIGERYLMPGALKLKNVDGSEDNMITAGDITKIGNALPDFTGGFSLSGFFKGFDFSANFNFMIGNQVYNANKIEFTSSRKDSYINRNLINMMNVDNRWTVGDWSTGELITDLETLRAQNSGKTMWSPLVNKAVFTNWAVEDASFLRLQSATIGYTLPETLTQKVKLKKARIYVTGTNLFCLTKYSGYDPEVDTRRTTPLTPGVDYSAYPKSIGFVAGLNLTF